MAGLDEMIKGIVKGDQKEWASFSNVLPFIKSLADKVKEIATASGGPGKFFGAGSPPQSPMNRPGLQGMVAEAGAAQPPLAASHGPTVGLPPAPEMAVSHKPFTAPPAAPPAPAAQSAAEVQPPAPAGVSPIDQLYKDLVDTKNQLSTKLAEMEKAGEKMTAEKQKVVDDLISSLRQKETEMKSMAFPQMNVPPPPELQDTQKNLGVLAPILSAAISIATMLRGGKTAIAFADTYNGMVDAFREYDYTQFMLKSREWENFLKAETATNNQKLLEYEDTISKIMRGVSTETEIAKLKAEQVQTPLQLNMQYFKLLEDLTARTQAILTAAQTQQYHNIMAMFSGMRVQQAERAQKFKESQEGYKRQKAQAETTAAIAKTQESAARIRHLDAQAKKLETETGMKIQRKVNPKTGKEALYNPLSNTWIELD